MTFELALTRSHCASRMVNTIHWMPAQRPHWFERHQWPTMCQNLNPNCTKTARPIHLKMFARALCCYWPPHFHSPSPWLYSVRRHRSMLGFPSAIAQPSLHMQPHLPARTMAFASAPTGMPKLSAGHGPSRLSLGRCSPANCSLRRMCTLLGTHADTSGPTVNPTVRPNTNRSRME